MPISDQPVIFHGAAITDARSDKLRLDVDVVVDRGVVLAIEDSGKEYSARGPGGERVVDARGATIVPGLVDCHSHLTMSGGAHWVARASDPDDVQLETAEHNAALLRQSGVRWARDAGAARARDEERALSLVLRDRWRGNREYPYLAVGSDFGGGSLRANQLSWEIEQIAALGVPLWEVLAGATWRAGDLLGEPEAGRLRLGGPADFFLVHGDPLTDVRALSRVWMVA